MPSSHERPDVKTRDVATRWLAGETYLELANAYGCTPKLIGNRLQKARREFPELSWSEPRRTGPPPPERGVVHYIRMTDGRPGEFGTSGSITKGRKR